MSWGWAGDSKIAELWVPSYSLGTKNSKPARLIVTGTEVKILWSTMCNSETCGLHLHQLGHAAVYFWCEDIEHTFVIGAMYLTGCPNHPPASWVSGLVSPASIGTQRQEHPNIKAMHSHWEKIKVWKLQWVIVQTSAKIKVQPVY